MTSVATEDLSKWKHIVKIAFLLGALMALIYTMGWHMGQDECRKKIIAAIKADSTHEAGLLLAKWSKDEPGNKSDPLFYLACASIHLRNGRHDACKYNLDKAIEMAGR
jgi:hypothetical protein